ncbi:MAG: ABC transporter [Candidatus Anoxymicrobium japonicum]|uniref:Transport permease protein n=1 Tax=Candidatus Anoxymicrobium japonicum TaxID=2013648 RepID=A0A2N3G8E4_9ACTN|nr:MAG: ABC transporter [Candidatus Anoxymicrobium japonicum]
MMIERLKDLWCHRELLFNMTRKELKVKYKRSVLGFVWSFMTPLIMLAVFSLVFSILAKTPMNWFVIYLMSGLFPWLFFVNSLMQSVGSVVGNPGLVKKVYFPREVLPIASVGANIFHFILQMLILLLFLVIIGWHFSIYILYLPLVMLLEIVLTMGLALCISSANVYLRDVQHFTEVATMAWFWLCPIVYTIGAVMGQLGSFFKLYLCNPMTNIVQLYQFIIYNPRFYAPKSYIEARPPRGQPAVIYLSFWGIFATIVLSVLLLVFGYYYFIMKERGFAEQI